MSAQCVRGIPAFLRPIPTHSNVGRAARSLNFTLFREETKLPFFLTPPSQVYRKKDKVGSHPGGMWVLSHNTQVRWYARFSRLASVPLSLLLLLLIPRFLDTWAKADLRTPDLFRVCRQQPRGPSGAAWAEEGTQNKTLMLCIHVAINVM